MMLPLQVTFRNMESTPSVQRAVERRAAALTRFHPRMTGCRVTIEAPHRSHRRGNLYRVRVDVTVPGAEIVAGRDPAENGAHEELAVAIRDAFRAARRRIQVHHQRLSGEVKNHPTPHRGRIARLFPEEGYGYLATDDGREIYFHRNSVLGRFEDLATGDLVRYDEEAGVEGPQASTVAAARRGLPAATTPRRSPRLIVAAASAGGSGRR